MQKDFAAKVAEVGVTLLSEIIEGRKVQRSASFFWSPKVLYIGRYLCWAFYRDQGALLRAFPELQEVFEEAVRAYAPWGELLSGAYRVHSKCSRFMTGSARLRNRRAKVVREDGSVCGSKGAGTKAIIRYPQFGMRVDNFFGGMWYGRNSVDGTAGLHALEVCMYQFVAERALFLWLGLASN